jgi:hypothetical protein
MLPKRGAAEIIHYDADTYLQIRVGDKRRRSKRRFGFSKLPFCHKKRRHHPFLKPIAKSQKNERKNIALKKIENSQ